MGSAKGPEKFCFYILFCFCIFVSTGFGFCLLSFLVPFALYLQQFGTRTFHFAWYLLHLAMFAFHFASYLPHFGISTSHVNGICYILVFQTFMWVSRRFLEGVIYRFFRDSFKVSLGFHVGFSFRVALGFHLGFLQGFSQCFFRASFQVSGRVSLRYPFRFQLEFL